MEQARLKENSCCSNLFLLWMLWQCTSCVSCVHGEGASELEESPCCQQPFLAVDVVV